MTKYYINDSCTNFIAEMYSYVIFIIQVMFHKLHLVIFSCSLTLILRYHLHITSSSSLCNARQIQCNRNANIKFNQGVLGQVNR